MCVTGWKTRPRPKTVILLIKQSINQSICRRRQWAKALSPINGGFGEFASDTRNVFGGAGALSCPALQVVVLQLSAVQHCRSWCCSCQLSNTAGRGAAAVSCPALQVVVLQLSAVQHCRSWCCSCQLSSTAGRGAAAVSCPALQVVVLQLSAVQHCRSWCCSCQLSNTAGRGAAAVSCPTLQVVALPLMFNTAHSSFV